MIIATTIDTSSVPTVVPMICCTGVPPTRDTTSGRMPQKNAGASAIRMFSPTPPSAIVHSMLSLRHAVRIERQARFFRHTTGGLSCACSRSADEDLPCRPRQVPRHESRWHRCGVDGHGSGAVLAQFSRPRHNPRSSSRRLEHQPRVLAHGVETDLLPVFKRRQSPSTPLMTLLTNASSPGWWLDVLVRP